MDINDLASKADLALLQREISQLREAVTSQQKLEVNKLLTPSEVCELLKISLNTLKSMRQRKEIKFKKLGKSIYRFPADQFKDL
jgi:excisionase family DNA binding protein